MQIYQTRTRVCDTSIRIRIGKLLPSHARDDRSWLCMRGKPGAGRSGLFTIVTASTVKGSQ